VNTALYDIIGILLLFILGFSYSIFFMGDKRLFRTSVVSVPLGLGVWSVLWIVLNIFMSLIGLEDNYYVSVAVFCILLSVSIYFFYISRGIFRNRKFKYTLIISPIILLLITIFFHNLRTSIIFGDSYAFITWSYELKDLVSRGLPGFGLSVSNLSALFLPDYYNYSIHPIISLSLLLLIFDSIYNYRSLNGKNNYIKFALSVLLVFLVLSANNFIWQAFYVNQHNLTAIFILLLSIFLLEKKKEYSIGEKIYIVGLLTAITTIRMEGMLLSFGLILFFLYYETLNFSVRRSIVSAYLVISGFYVLFLSSVLWGNELFSAKKYGAVWILFFIFFLTENIIFRKYPKLMEFIKFAALGASFSFLLFLIIINYGHMTESIGNFASNTFNQILWGLTNYVLIILSLLVIAFRIKRKESIAESDALFYYFICCIILILVLSNFRPPYKPGWPDSGNRMLLHFLPLLPVWIGIELNRFFEK